MMPAGSPYSPLKIFRHQANLAALRDGQHVAPIHVQLLPTSICNQACEGCAYRIPGYSSNELFNLRDQIPGEKLLEIVSDCAAMGVRAIEITGGGEPTLHPDFQRMCEAILQRDMDLALVSNGTRLDNRLVDLLLRARWVRISIDAGTAETYARYRHTTPLVFHNVRNSLRELCGRRSGEDLVVGVGFVVNDVNWREVVTAAENAKADGADNFRISALFQPGGSSYFEPFLEDATNLCREAESLTDSTFRVFNRFEDRVADLEQGHPAYRTCWFQQVCTYIGSDLTVYRCCVLGYNRRGVLGSLENKRFSSLWFSEEMIENLKQLDARACSLCMYSRTNEAIAYAACQEARHENFIG